MKIKRMISQHRRDFYAIYECENCGYVSDKKSGYDDRNFHDNVIPNMICPECKKSTNNMGLKADKTLTKYPDWITV